MNWQDFAENVRICHSFAAPGERTLKRMSLLTRIREFLATQAELAERHALLNCPWEEDLLHWSFDGREWHLHGHLPPPNNRRRYSTTRQGWCPGLRAVAAREEQARQSR